MVLLNGLTGWQRGFFRKGLAEGEDDYFCSGLRLAHAWRLETRWTRIKDGGEQAMGDVLVAADADSRVSTAPAWKWQPRST